MENRRRKGKSQEGVPPGRDRRRTTPVEVPMPSAGIYVLESHHAAGFRMELGRWPFHKLCWLPVGRGYLELSGKRVVLERNQFALIPAETQHRFVDDPADPMTLVIVCVANELFAAGHPVEASLGRLWSSFPCAAATRARSSFHFHGIRDCFQRMLREQSRAAAGYEAMLHGLLGQLVVLLLRGVERADDTRTRTGSEAALEGLLEELETQFDRPITLDDAAARCGLSPRRFSELFRIRVGSTLIEYVNRKRIDYAKERLRETGHVAYACYESGFQDLAYFYRVFKRYAGTTPGAFLKDAER